MIAISWCVIKNHPQFMIKESSVTKCSVDAIQSFYKPHQKEPLQERIFFLGPRGPLRVPMPARPPVREVFILVILNRHKGTATKAPPLKHRHKGHRLQRSLRQFLDKNHLLV